MDKTKKRILCTGGKGMVGSAIRDISCLYEDYDFVFVGSKDYNLISRDETRNMFQDIKPNWVIHLAAKVGGLKCNMDNLGSMYTENAYINLNTLEEARLANVEKLVSVLSTCVYPWIIDYPLEEYKLHLGEPHYSNYGYAFIKRGLDVQSRMYRKQYGCNFITAIPNNLIGCYDQFDYDNSHAIAAIIRKIYEAKKFNKSGVVIWGNGTSYREFLYAKDFAKILIKMLEKYDDLNPLNVGNPEEISIKKVVETVCDILEYKGVIGWDNLKPSGQIRKPSSNSKLLSYGWWKETDYTSFNVALREVLNWFDKNYPDNIRM